MPNAILIGFHYWINPIPGIVIDIYHAYRYCKRLGCQITIITDRTNLRGVTKAAIAGVVDEGIISFDLKDALYVQTRDSFLKALINIQPPQDGKLIVYYTGHGERDALLLPSGEEITTSELRQALISALAEEIVIILDCCSASAMRLPYKLQIEDKARFRLSKQPNPCFCIPHMLVLTSSADVEPAVATSYGSLFTRHIFGALEKIRCYEQRVLEGKSCKERFPRYLPHLIKYVDQQIIDAQTGHRQTISAYSSHPLPITLWGWMISGCGTKITYRGDFNCLRIS